MWAHSVYFSIDYPVQFQPAAYASRFFSFCPASRGYILASVGGDTIQPFDPSARTKLPTTMSE
jgi:hypothetical protein